MSIHIAAQADQVAPRVLFPGDPLRAQWIADNYLEGAECYSQVRNMLGFTGTYQGERISVQGSGMGQPSMAIYANELFRDYGVQQLIRVGSCGALTETLKVRDV
ncbi:MAG: purine-nucleoside phosphorylase, partial [Actinomycetota bacterium]|nr:purine-nucleoside phosphorylase [Actinomycetota bacterium]